MAVRGGSQEWLGGRVPSFVECRTGISRNAATAHISAHMGRVGLRQGTQIAFMSHLEVLPVSALALTVDTDRVDVQLAIGGFLAGYSGNTLLAYRQDLRCYVSWCW